MNTIYKRGFTLIELLVVIAIIGILAGIVLASLNSARGGANDAKVQEQLNGVRTQAELVYSSSGNQYGTAAPASVDCPATASSLPGDTNIQALLTSLPAGPTGSQMKCAVAANRSAYAVAAPLQTAGNYWCVDSTGAARQVTITTIGNVVLTDSSCTAIDAR